MEYIDFILFINLGLMSCIREELLPKVKNVFANLTYDGTRSVMKIFEVILTQGFETMAAKAEDVLHDCHKKGWHLWCISFN